VPNVKNPDVTFTEHAEEDYVREEDQGSGSQSRPVAHTAEKLRISFEARYELFDARGEAFGNP
jgi:hypothetical protein